MEFLSGVVQLQLIFVRLQTILKKKHDFDVYSTAPVGRLKLLVLASTQNPRAVDKKFSTKREDIG